MFNFEVLVEYIRKIKSFVKFAFVISVSKMLMSFWERKKHSFDLCLLMTKVIHFIDLYSDWLLEILLCCHLYLCWNPFDGFQAHLVGPTHCLWYLKIFKSSSHCHSSTCWFRILVWQLCYGSRRGHNDNFICGISFMWWYKSYTHALWKIFSATIVWSI